MATLHIVNQTAALLGIESTLTSAQKDDAILFIGDAVYALASRTPLDTQAKIFALSPDLLARGLALDTTKYNYNVELVDYAGFVRLTELHHPVVSWY